MDAEARKRAKELFLEALELETQEREAFLRSECDDEEILAAARSLLGASERAGDYLEQPGAVAASALDEVVERLSDLTGRRVGPYRLESLLGRGGMGSVYLAERVDGLFGQRVAIKLLSLGARHEEGNRRFAAEREILARLQHPNIAALFDGGVTEDGTPYFVMEYVEGQPIHKYCDERGLTIPERLELFLQVCDAVAAAHRSAVVHRDLKPANILVAEGRVKLLDFGIAKMLAEHEASGDHQTGTGLALMTPAYASPEQVNGAEITPATDVYTLGVLLYGLLTGLLPYEVSDGSKLGYASAICNAAVTKPSARLAREQTGGTTTSLQRRIRGDLDIITLQALRKEPHQRYESVAAFAEDVRRHLDGFAVRARRENPFYRASRFARRHRLAAVTFGVAVVIVAVLLRQSLQLASSNTEKSAEVARERDLSGDLLTQLTELYRTADPYAAPQAGRASRAILDAAVGQLEANPAGDPHTQAQLLFAAARVYRRLGLEVEARPLLEESVRLHRERASGPDGVLADDVLADDDLAAALFELGASLSRGQEPEAGVALLTEVLEIERALHHEDHLHIARVLYERARSFHDTGRSGADEGFREAIRIFRALDTEPTEVYAVTMMSLGEFLAVTGGKEEALQLYEEANAILIELLGDHPLTARSYDGLGILYYNADRRDEGLDCMRRAVEIGRAVYGEAGHGELATQLVNYGAFSADAGDDEGVERLREALAMYRSIPTTGPSALGFCLTSLAHALSSRDPAEAIGVYEEALDVFAAGGLGPMYLLSAQRALATLLKQQGESQRHLELLREIADNSAATFGPDHARTKAAREEWRAAGGE